MGEFTCKFEVLEVGCENVVSINSCSRVYSGGLWWQ
jgi:hypothetical protein